MPHDGVPLRQPVRTDTEDDGDENGKFLGDGSEGESEPGQNHLLQWTLRDENAERGYEHAESQCNPDQPTRELLHRLLQRRPRLPRFRRQPRDAPDFASATGCDNEPLSSPRSDES